MVKMIRSAKKMYDPMSAHRVFIGPVEIAGYYGSLCQALRKAGVDCDFISYSPHPFGYGGETRYPLLIRLAYYCKDRLGPRGQSRLSRKFWALPQNLFLAIYGCIAIWRYDVFIFGFTHSLLPYNLDLPILCWLGKTVISNIGHGSEARPPYLNGANQSLSGERCELARMVHLTKRINQRVAFVERYSSIVIGAPFSSSHFSRLSFLNWFSLGLPICLTTDPESRESIKNSRLDLASSPIRILHSPSHPAAKGSKIISAAINRLIEKGYFIEYIMIHGRSNDEVLSEIIRCDFVVDQLYSDSPMATFAAEAAWFAKPAVVGGYGLDQLQRHIPKNMWPPSKTCHPDDIEKAIEELIVNREMREMLGAQAQKFVQINWSAAEVAKRYIRILEGVIPIEWWLAPESICYLEGMGQPVELTKMNLQQIIAQYGVKSLQLEHRPDLVNAFIEFAGISDQPV